MTGLLRAFAILRWRLFVNGLRGRRRDGFEQVSRISRLLVAAMIAVTLIPGSFMMAVFAFIGARGLAQGNAKADAVLVGAQAVLGLVTILVAITPVLRFGGAPSSSTRLSLLPVPRGLLYAAELTAQLADPWILAIVPPLLAFPAGLAAGGHPADAAFSLAVGGVMLGFLAALGSTASLLAALVFRNRRVGELATIGVLLVLSAAAFLPTAFIRDHANDPKSAVHALNAAERPWLAVMPWSLYTRAVDGPQPAPAHALALAALSLAGVSRWAFGRLLDTPADRRSGTSRTAKARRFPGLSPAAAAIAWTTFRLATRSVRGRVILFTSPIPVLMLAILWKRILVDSGWGSLVGVLVLGVGSALTLFSLQTILANQFAVDRAGLTLTFLGPASSREIVLGKAAGGALIFGGPVGIAVAIALALHPRGTAGLWVAALISALSAYVAQAPVAALVSASFPAPCDLMKLRAGNVHPLAGVIGMATALVASLAAAGLFIATFAMTGSALAVLASSLVGTAVAAGWAALALPLAAQAVELRRENLAMIAQGR